MNVAINCRTLNKRKGGPYRVLLNIIYKLFLLDNKNNYVLVFDKKPDFELENIPNNFKLVYLNQNSKIIYEYFSIPSFLKKNKFDFYISPASFFAPYIKTKTLNIIHDLIHFEKGFKREFNFFDYYHDKMILPFCFKKAYKNICVSNFTLTRAEKIFGLKNLVLIYNGLDEAFINNYNSGKFDDKINKPFIFYIGSLSPRKNILRLLIAFDKIKFNIPHNLYLFGGYSWCDKDVQNYIKNSNSRIKYFGKISDEELVYLYKNADLFLYPSIYEGFGLPILEAQFFGCPVLTSNGNACKEISGDGAFLVNPYSVQNIGDGILKVLNDDDLKNKLVNNGIQNIQRFSWESSVLKLISLYE